MGIRRKARECALQLLYELEFNGISGERETDRCLEDYWSTFSETNAVGDDVREFTEKLVLGVRDHIEVIDELIQAASTNWKLERMALVDRNILRVATYELRPIKAIPPKVSLNEAIEIAKRYGSGESSAFINGILDKISGMP